MSLQAKITKIMKDLWCFSCIIARVEYYKKGASRQNNVQIRFKNVDNKEYKVEVICNNMIYAKELESGYLPGLYYQILWKSYSEEKNT